MLQTTGTVLVRLLSRNLTLTATVLLMLVSLVSPAIARNEDLCIANGIKPNTYAFNRCLNELGARDARAEKISPPIYNVPAPSNAVPNEQICARNGFHRGTNSFNSCLNRLALEQIRSGVAVTVSPQTAAVNSPPSNAETCIRYGFKRDTTPFSQCVMQIDNAAQQAEYQQRLYELEFQKYKEQQAAFQAQQEDAERDRERQKWERLARVGFGMAASSSPSASGGLADGLAAGGGYQKSAPLPPSPPTPQSFTIRTPSGSQVFCQFNPGARFVMCN